jgi:hypothetical protein
VAQHGMGEKEHGIDVRGKVTPLYLKKVLLLKHRRQIDTPWVDKHRR